MPEGPDALAERPRQSRLGLSAPGRPRCLPAIPPPCYNSRKGDPLMSTRTNRVPQWLSAVLAAAVLGGIGLPGARLRPYWVAGYRGEGADLYGALLPHAP